MAEPLLLVNVPNAIQQLYQNLRTFITEQCGLSIRYVSHASFQNPDDLAAFQLKIRDAILNTNSLRTRALEWELDQDGRINYSTAPAIAVQQKHTTQQIIFKRAPKSERSDTISEIDTMITDALRDRGSVIKVIGLDVARLDKSRTTAHKIFVPIWGWGLCAAEADECKDREIKFIFSDERTDTEQLHLACFLHSLIEACWWYPPGSASQPLGSHIFPQAATDDNKKLVSAIVDENVCYFSMSSVLLMERLNTFDQHFEDNSKRGRAHTSIPCTCQKLKSYSTSFLMKKVALLKNIFREDNLENGELCDWAKKTLDASGGPEPRLRLSLSLLKQAGLESSKGRLAPTAPAR